MEWNGGVDYWSGVLDWTRLEKGGQYIVTCISTRDRGQDLDPSNFRA